MPYYFVNLSLHLLVSAGILALILFLGKKNNERKHRRGVAFLLPAILTIVFLIQVISLSIPRTLDIVHVLKNNYRSTVGTVTSIGFLNNTVVIDGTTYYFDPFQFKPQTGDELFITYTPNAHYIYEFRPVESDSQSITE